MRLFLGIGIPAACRRAIVDAIAPVRQGRPAVSWVPEQNLHITVKFLGETPSSRVEEIYGLLATAGGGIAAFDLPLEGGGTFPAAGMPRVLFAGVGEPLESVVKLHENIEDALSSVGFPREGRRFHPHITVGRVRGRLSQGFREQFGAAVAGATFGVAPVASFQLYESRLYPTGAVYSVVRDVPLAPPGNS